MGRYLTHSKARARVGCGAALLLYEEQRREGSPPWPRGSLIGRLSCSFAAPQVRYPRQSRGLVFGAPDRAHLLGGGSSLLTRQGAECRWWILTGASRFNHELPYAEPHVRWCGRTAGVTPPPTRYAHAPHFTPALSWVMGSSTASTMSSTTTRMPTINSGSSKVVATIARRRISVLSWRAARSSIAGSRPVCSRKARVWSHQTVETLLGGCDNKR